MANLNALNYLYKERKSALDFDFDMLIAPPLLSLLTYQDIYELNNIAKSVKLSSKIDEKYRMIDNIMNHRGFIKLHAGTNRVVYRFIEDQRFVIKVAVDRVGLGDNPAEFRNQFLLKPFVTKVFEVSPCGTVALVERVDPILSREEFASVADDIFTLITQVFVGRYVIDDFGTYYFMNWAIRNSFGPVLLDFPYVYELDGNKLYCNAPIDPFHRNIKCGGEIDYDAGFNNLVCTKCGKLYNARDLAKKKGNDDLIIVGGKKTMRVVVRVGKEVILDSSKQQVAKVIDPAPSLRLTEDESIIEETVEKVEKPRAAIFHKEEVHEEVVEESKVEEEIVESTEDDVTEVLDNEPIEEESIEEIVEESETAEEVIEEPIEKEKTDLEKRMEKMDMEIEEMERELAELEDDDYDDEEYSQFLSNRERSKIRKVKKQQNRSSDYSDF